MNIASEALAAGIAAALAAGCGTYSMIRPAQVLPQGHVEVAAGLAVSDIGEADPVFHAAAGLGANLELLGQYEIWNAIAELRYQVLKSDSVDVAVGVGGGTAETLLSSLTTDSSNAISGGAGTASVAIGHDWGNVALTAGNRTFYLSGGYVITASRLGVRLRVADHLRLLLEAGATVHVPGDNFPAFVVGEGTAGFALQF